MNSFVLNRDLKNRINTVLNVDTDSNTIEIYDYIISEKYYEEQLGITANEFVNQLNKMNGRVTVRINSKGGEVGNALTIYQRLKDYKNVDVIVDGYAYSSAAWIMLAGENRTINAGGLVMIHNPLMYVEISKLDDFDNIKNQWVAHQESIINIIVSNTTLKSDKVKSMMDATTFMTAKEAINNGFAHGIQSDNKVFNQATIDAMPSELNKSIFKPDYSREKDRMLNLKAKRLV